MLAEFMRPRKLEWKGNPNPTKPKTEANPAAESAKPAEGLSKNAAKKAAKMEELRKKKEAAAAAAAGKS
jgi:tryptophanyl-tRNA synthetase